MSKIVVFEGADRCGKATQSAMLTEFLNSIGYKATRIEVPIKGSFTYKLIYWMLQNGLAKKFPKIFQRLQYLNRWIFQKTTLAYLEDSYDYIVFDRWTLSTVAYGIAEGLSKEFCEKLYNNLRTPDFTVLLLGKSFRHEAEDVYESDNELQRKVRLNYADWASKNSSQTYVVLDSTSSKEKISSNIVNYLQMRGIITQQIGDKK